MSRLATARSCLHVVAVLATASAAFATEARLPSPASAAWRSIEFPTIAEHTVYEVVQADGIAAFKAQADCSASGMVVSAESIDLDATPVLRWRWRVEKGVDAADERTKAGDDFAARVYVMFHFDDANASWLQRLTRAVTRQVYGDVIPGNAINYVWSSSAAVGQGWKSPYTEASQIIVKGTGESGGWVESRADVVADYRAAFGHEPTALLSVGVMSDADNTCRKAVAYFADFRFTPRRRGVP